MPCFSPSLGNFKLLPQFCTYPDGCAVELEDRKSPQVNNSAKGSPGFFSISLQNGIDAKVTSTDHVAFYNFDFTNALKNNTLSTVKHHKQMKERLQKEAAQSPSDTVLLLDLTQDLPQTYQGIGALNISISTSPPLSEADKKYRRAKITGYGTF